MIAAHQQEQKWQIFSKRLLTIGVVLKYLVASCPALVTLDNFVRTENTHALASTTFPDAQAGNVLGRAFADGAPSAGDVPAGADS